LDYLSFLKDEDAVDAAFARIAMIGEAISNLPTELLDQYPGIPWMRIKGMRNYLIHVYFGVNLHILWDTMTVEIPRLRLTVEKIIVDLYPPTDSLNR
jgi:uncharacterized protein with HEPN domain